MGELKRKRGFALMPPEKLRAVSSAGGKAAQLRNGHKWTSDEAKAAGAKGGRRAFENRVIREAEGRIAAGTIDPDAPIPHRVVE